MVLLTESTVYSVSGTVLLVFVATYLYFKYKFRYWKKLGVPFIEPTFPYGNFSESTQLTKTFGIILADFYNEMKSKGHKFFGTYLFHIPVLVLVDPDLVKSIMSRDFGYFYDRGVYHDEENDPLSAHLFAMEGHEWKKLRAKLTPTFTSGKLKKMFQTLVDSSLELKDCLNESIGKSEPVDIKQVSAQYTTDVIGSCAFGIDCNSFKDPDAQFVKVTKKVFTPNFFDRIKMFSGVLFPSILKFFKIRVTNKEVDSFYRNLVKDTVEYREKNNVTRNDFMQLLIQLKNKEKVDDEHDIENEIQDHKHEEFELTMKSLTAQSFVFFLAGFETSSTSITWTLFELSKYITIQDKLREELIRVMQKHNNKITYDAVMEMPYLDRVVQEALRKYPPIMVLQRTATANYTIPETDIVIKKGTTILIPNQAIQLDPEFYPDPEKFDPDRFLEENKSTRPDYTWLPFGEGPRICIGLRFGIMQVKVGLCQLLLNYKFTLNPKTVYPPIFDPNSFVSASKDTIWLDAQRINN